MSKSSKLRLSVPRRRLSVPKRRRLALKQPPSIIFCWNVPTRLPTLRLRRPRLVAPWLRHPKVVARKSKTFRRPKAVARQRPSVAEALARVCLARKPTAGSRTKMKRASRKRNANPKIGRRRTSEQDKIQINSIAWGDEHSSNLK